MDLCCNAQPFIDATVTLTALSLGFAGVSMVFLLIAWVKRKDKIEGRLGISAGLAGLALMFFFIKIMV